MRRLALSFLFSSTILLAQTATANYIPSMVIGSGVVYDYYGKTGFALQQSFALRVCSLTNSCTDKSANLYSFSTLTNNRDTSSITTGAAFCPFVQGYLSVCVLGTAGLAGISSSPVLGQFTFGGTLQYDIGAFIKTSHHIYIQGSLTGFNTTSQVTLKPLYGLGFALGF